MPDAVLNTPHYLACNEQNYRMTQRRDEPFLYKKEGEKSVAMVTRNWQNSHRQTETQMTARVEYLWLP